MERLDHSLGTAQPGALLARRGLRPTAWNRPRGSVQTANEEAQGDLESRPKWEHLRRPDPRVVVDRQLRNPRLRKAGRAEKVGLQIEAARLERNPTKRVGLESPHPRADVRRRDAEEEAGQRAEDAVPDRVEGRHGAFRHPSAEARAEDDIVPGGEGLEEPLNRFRRIGPVRIEHEEELRFARPAVRTVPGAEQVVERLAHPVSFPPPGLDEHARPVLAAHFQGAVRRAPVDEPDRHGVSGRLELGSGNPVQDLADRAFLIYGRQEDDDMASGTGLRAVPFGARYVAAMLPRSATPHRLC